MTIMFDRVAFIGIGLIGSSLARVIRRDGLAREIVASARSEATLDKVMKLGLADRVYADPAEAGRRVGPEFSPGSLTAGA